MSDEITIEEFEARFDIERRTMQCCMKYLEEYAKIFPEHFKEFFEGTSTFTFKKRPSHWGESACWGKELLAELEILGDGVPLAVYTACYDLEGNGRDDWLHSSKKEEQDGDVQPDNPADKGDDDVDNVPDENGCDDTDEPELVTPETKEGPLTGEEWSKLLIVKPEYAPQCDWSTLGGVDWAKLLKTQPQFADQCNWSCLNGFQWLSLLRDQPQFADKCDWNKLAIDGHNHNRIGWCALLMHHPQFADKCDLSGLNGISWTLILAKQPQLSDKCPWKNLDGSNWSKLLAVQPQFADKCDFSLLNEDDWGLLLAHQPHFASRRKPAT